MMILDDGFLLDDIKKPFNKTVCRFSSLLFCSLLSSQESLLEHIICTHKYSKV